MKQFPFTDYDFWGYLAAGFLLLFALDFSFSSGLLMKRELTVVEAIVAGSMAYVAGQLIAGVSSAVLERRLSGWVGKPLEILCGTASIPRWGSFVYPSYFESLPPATLSALKAKQLPQEDIQSLFRRAHRVTLADSKSSERLASFLNQYGFCRNVSFAAICATCTLLLCWAYTEKPTAGTWACIAMAVAIGMYFRYLKFNRLFVNEVLTTFAYQKEETK